MALENIKVFWYYLRKRRLATSEEKQFKSVACFSKRFNATQSDAIAFLI